MGVEGINVDPVVRTLGGKDGTSAEGAEVVGWLRMGHVVDTQRRRRNKLDEAYTVIDLAA